jgi:predicted ArsR family transcriptional regulator
MISCTEFIPAYNELFAFIEERHGRQELIRFWEELADEFLHNLRDLVAEKGLAGMHEYWTHTLTEEGADQTMTLSEDEFRIEMHKCPSVAILRQSKHITPFPDYCEHCKVLYRRVIEPFGFKCEVQVHDEGQCTLRVTKR